MKCKCGCGADSRPNGRYANDACRARAWKARRSYVHPRDRRENGENGGQRRRAPRPRKPSDVRVSFTQLADALGRDAALQVLTPAQRSRLPR